MVASGMIACVTSKIFKGRRGIHHALCMLDWRVRFAKEMSDVFIERQLVALYIARQDKHIQQVVHP